MTVEVVKTEDRFNEILKENKKVVVQLTASWCKPCQRISPVYQKLAEEYKDVKFVKIDCSEESPEWNKSEVLPTFKFYYQGNEETSSIVQGANEKKLRERIKEF